MIKRNALNFRSLFLPIFVLTLTIVLSLSLFQEHLSFAQSEADQNESLSSILSLNTTMNDNVLNPGLVELTSQFSPAKIVQVSPDIYTAVGYGPSNIVLVDGKDGIVIIDSGSSTEQAEKVLGEFRKITKKPISALIYTNGRGYNIGGGGIFVNESKDSDHKVDVIASSQFMENIFPMVGQISKQSSLYELYINGILLSLSNSSDYPTGSGLGPVSKLGNISFAAPTVLFNDTLKTTYSGINMTLISAPGPSPEQIFVWLPEKEVVVTSDIVYPAFPKIYTMSGIQDVDIPTWINSIDEMKLLNPKHIIPGHLQHASGYENVSSILTSYRDGISYVVQQTIRLINKGFDVNEISEILQLPPYLKNHPWLQERLGQIPWTVRQIYTYVVGWNSGDATWFNPVSLSERGTKIVNGFGGINATIDQIKKSMDMKEYDWAAELSTYVLFAYPDNEQAKVLKADALRRIGWQNPTVEGRNWYLTQANILSGNINASTLQNMPNTNLVNEALKTISIDDLLYNMLFKLDPVNSPDEDVILGIYLNDTQQGYTLEVRNDVVTYDTSFPEQFDIAINTDSDTLKDILLGKTKLLDGIAQKKINIDGDIRDLSKFVRSFDQKFLIEVYKW